MIMKKIFSSLPILFDTRSMGFMGSWSIIIVAIPTKVKINIVIVHILLTIVHLFVASAIMFRVLVGSFTISLSFGSRFNYGFGLWS
jgi:hypothetical protein